MRYFLDSLDYNDELTKQLKKQHLEGIEDYKNTITDVNESDYIMLYHGTTLSNLNEILLNGILPRNTTGKSNFTGDILSNENLVYMTNKWHYFYAYNASENEKNEQVIENSLGYLPCYVEARVPKALLVEDEDFFHSRYVSNKLKNCIKKNNNYFELTGEECLAQYGTVAVLEDIKREWLFSFTVIADLDIFHKNFISPKSQYAKDLSSWARGRSKGKLKFIDLVELEDSYRNITYWMKDIPDNHIISDAFINERTNQLSLVINKVR